MDTKLEWTLELIVVPVSDIDRAKAFYIDNAAFRLDVDHSGGADFRVVQLTPVGSACSIALMKSEAPGSLRGLHLVVKNIDVARSELCDRGVDVSEVFHFDQDGQRPGPDPARANYNSFCSFQDPDGNTWLLQEVDRTRTET